MQPPFIEIVTAADHDLPEKIVEFVARAAAWINRQPTDNAALRLVSPNIRAEVRFVASSPTCAVVVQDKSLQTRRATPIRADLPATLRNLLPEAADSSPPVAMPVPMPPPTPTAAAQPKVTKTKVGDTFTLF